MKDVIIHITKCLLSVFNLEMSIFGRSLMSGCFLSIFLGDLLRIPMKFLVTYVNARVCPCPGQPVRVESFHLLPDGRCSVTVHSVSVHNIL